MIIENKSGQDFLINCCEDRDEVAVIWYELNRRGEDIKGVSSTICKSCFITIYTGLFSTKEIDDMFNNQ